MKKGNLINKFLVLILLILVTCSGCKEKNKDNIMLVNKLRFDGLYCYIGDFDNDGFIDNYVLRFYEDGSVITALITQTEDSDGYFPKSKWFDKSNDKYKDYVGKYKLDGKNISFTTLNEITTFDYKGTIEGNKLVLRYHSNYNDHTEDNREYVFYSFKNVPDWE